MSFCFIVAGSDDRDYLLDRCVSCIKNNRNYHDSDVYLYWQGSANKIPYKDFYKDVVIVDSLQGVFLPRYVLFDMVKDKYDYVILIDDDSFMYPDTSYESAMTFLHTIEDNGVCNIGSHFDKRRNEIRTINYNCENYNVQGGIVFPRKCVNLVVEYFREKRTDVTEDIFWILLFVKGYDLYRDFSSNLIHTCRRPARDGSVSGYYRLRIEKPNVPLLPEYTNAKLVKDDFGDRMRYKIPECRDVNDAGLEERARCRREMGL